MNWLDSRPGDCILDIGCGSGAAVAFIAERVGPDGCAVGLERFPETLGKASVAYPAIGTAGPHWVSGVGQALPFADGTFDAVLCVNVLEAIHDRPLALAEMWRVLKPGGRVLVAHDDYESLAYAGADRELTRRAVHAYANSTFKSYETSDGEMGRQLWGLFSQAGFTDAEIRVLPLVNTEYRSPFFGWILAQFGADFVATVSDLTQDEIDRWHRQLTEASERGEYLFCANLYVCLGRKPESSPISGA